jgi:hypothetical protein
MHSECFLISSTPNDEHNDVLRPVFELTGPEVRVAGLTEPATDHLIQNIEEQRLVLCIDILHSLKRSMRGSSSDKCC